VTNEKKTRANGRASRQAILTVAHDVFAERGHRGTSLSEIASRVGMTQPGLLHHFPTKDELLLEVVRNQEERTRTTIQEHLTAEAFDLKQAIRALASVNKAASVEHLLLTTLSAEAIPEDHPLHDYFVSRYRDSRSRLAAVLESAQAEGKIRADVNPAQAAREIIATLDGLHLQWLLDPRKVDLEQVLEQYADRLEADLTPARRGRRPSQAQ
jgi:AcrR family transcriptional regulator